MADPEAVRLVREIRAGMEPVEDEPAEYADEEALQDAGEEETMQIDEGNEIMKALEGTTTGGNGTSQFAVNDMGVELPPEPSLPDPMPNPDFAGPAVPHAPAPEVVVSRSPIRRVKPVQNRQQQRGAGLPEINAVMGSAVSFRFSKIDDKGGVAYINEFTTNDLRPFGNDIERFIREALLNQYGDGGYFVEAKDEHGAVVKQKRYSVLSPYKPPSPGYLPTGAIDNRIIDRLLTNIDDAVKNKPQPDPIAQLRALQEVVGNRGDSAMMMMMMMQQQNQPNSELAALRAQLLELQRQVMTPPPPPPPPAQPTLMEQFVQVLPVVMPLIQPLIQRPKEPSFIEQATQLATVFGPMISHFMGERTSTAAEVHKIQLEHLKEKIDDLSQGDNITQTIENLKQAKNLFKEIGPSGTDSALKYFAENWENNARATAEMVRALRGKDDAQPKLAGSQPAQLPAGQPAPAQPTAAPEEPLPEEFIEAVGHVNEVTTDRERLLCMFAALRVLYQKSHVYRSVPARMLVQIKMGFSDKFTESITMLTTDLVGLGLLSDGSAKAVVRAAKDNFDEIRKLIQDGLITLGDAAEGEDAEEAQEDAPETQA